MRAERSLPRPEDILERSADGVALLDPEGFTLYTNPAALRLLGLAAPEPGLFLDRLHPDDRSAFRAACDAALESGEAGTRPANNSIHSAVVRADRAASSSSVNRSRFSRRALKSL